MREELDPIENEDFDDFDEDFYSKQRSGGYSNEVSDRIKALRKEKGLFKKKKAARTKAAKISNLKRTSRLKILLSCGAGTIGVWFIFLFAVGLMLVLIKNPLGGGDGGSTIPSERENPSGNLIVEKALNWLGTPYAWGGGNCDGPTASIRARESQVGFDCSGLVLYAVCQASDGRIKLDHWARTQCGSETNPPQVGTKINDRDSLQAGDLVCFKSGTNPVHHVGIYYGNGEFIHAPRTGDVVKIDDLSKRGDYVWGVRNYY